MSTGAEEFVWAILGIIFILMNPSGLREIVANDNKAAIGLLFLVIALMHHLLYLQRKRSREMLASVADMLKTQEEASQPAPAADAAPSGAPTSPPSAQRS